MKPSFVFKHKPTLKEINDRMLPDQLAGHLGIEFTEITENTVSAKIEIGKMHSRPGGIMSGGTTLALIETVGSVAGMLAIDPKIQNVFGVEVSANHVGQVALGETIIATASPDHVGRTIQVWSVRIQTQKEKLICVGRITLFVAERS